MNWILSFFIIAISFEITKVKAEELTCEPLYFENKIPNLKLSSSKVYYILKILSSKLSALERYKNYRNQILKYIYNHLNENRKYGQATNIHNMSNLELLWILRDNGLYDDAVKFEEAVLDSMNNANFNKYEKIDRFDENLKKDPRELITLDLTNDMTAIAKVDPADWDIGNLRFLFLKRMGSVNLKAEKLALDFDRILKLYFIPPGVLRVVNGKYCFVTEKIKLNDYGLTDKNELILLEMFYYLIGQTDGLHNYSVSAHFDNHLVAFDHSLAFHGVFIKRQNNFLRGNKDFTSLSYDIKYLETKLIQLKNMENKINENMFRNFYDHLLNELTPIKITTLMTPDFNSPALIRVLNQRRDLLNLLERVFDFRESP
jgi:hypothetical protein